ncbi:MAG: hypothetical protein H6726_17795 [Sandaracinaceae bacterium]|nr:hypothetical protein [Sandaracinaceae bacterium]
MSEPTDADPTREPFERGEPESPDAADPHDDGHPASPAEGSDAGRGRVRAFIVALVALQLLVPLTYYLRDDPYDERFAWRMFSGVRLQQCRTSAFETGANGVEQQVDPFRLVTPGWVANLSRNRRPVIESYLEHRCDVGELRAVRVLNVCQGVDGEAVPPREYARDCATGGTP